jgi:hypothetical protein
MSNEAAMKRINERNAAHLLMTEFVKREASEIARALESIIVLHREVNYESLTENMSVVNQTFASLALTLIDHNAYLDPEDSDNMILPVGAKQMKVTIEDLSKFIKSTRLLLWMLFDKFEDDAAVKLASETFFEYDNQF